MQREREGKKWWGLDVLNRVAQQGEIKLHEIFAIAEEKESFGERIDLTDQEWCALTSEELMTPSEKKINVVINESWSLKDVKLVARGCLANLANIPEQVRVMFCYYPGREILVFENVAGKRVYVLADYAETFHSEET